MDSNLQCECRTEVGLDFDLSETEQSIPDRFEKVVAQYPERLALRAGETSFSYRELDAASDAVAIRLLEMAGGEAEPVCLIAGQGAELVTAILGTLKAGKIYLALDPSHPRAELTHIVEHSRAQLFICDAANLSITANLARPGQGILDLASIGMRPSGSGPMPKLSPDRLAYIFYTSGSTGAPKGVMDCHRNVLHNVMRYTRSLDIGPADRLSMIQSSAFSGTVSSLFGALLNGAAIFPFDLQTHGVEAMAGWLVREEITIFHSVPMIFEQLSAAVQTPPQLRLIRLEGDRTEPRHLVRYQERFGPHTAVVNGLGATETGLVRQFFFAHGDKTPPSAVPIGYPVADMDIRLLDEAGREVPVGEIGEIAVASRYLATGYWRRPEATEDAFRPDPADLQRRIYRTRDLGRMLPDGCLEYLGRADLQAKLRGVRVDLPAIEAALSSEACIDRALVTVREDRPGVQRLVAYLVNARGTEIAIPALRRTLSRLLPAVMMPSRFVILDHIPLDRNRKVDKRALPPPGRERPELDTPYVAPTTDRQKAIATCFSEILAVDFVGLNDDFFELGGDSLLATELLLMVDKRMRILCPSDFLYSAPTVAGMDRRLESETHVGNLQRLQPEGNLPPLFCIHGTSGYVLEYRDLARLIGPDRPVYGIQNRNIIAPGRGDAPHGVEEMASAAATEIIRAQRRGPYNLCGNCLGGLVALETARRLRAMGNEVGFLGLIDTGLPKGIVRGFGPLKSMRDYREELARVPSREMIGFVFFRLRQYLDRIKRRGLQHMHLFAAKKGVPRTFNRIASPENEPQRLSLAHFRPKPYDGTVTLFSPGLPDKRAEWRDILPDLRVVDVGGSFPIGRRPHLVGEPHVREFANVLRAHLIE